MSDAVHFADAGELADVTVSVSALCGMLDLTRGRYEDLQKRGIVAKAGSRLLLAETVSRYAAHLQKTEETAQANLARIRSQTKFTEQRYRNEVLITEEREGSLIPLADAQEEARKLGVDARRFLEQAVGEAAKRIPAEERSAFRAELSELMAEMLARHAES